MSVELHSITTAGVDLSKVDPHSLIEHSELNMRTIKSRVRALCDELESGVVDNKQFAQWLTQFACQANEVIAAGVRKAQQSHVAVSKDQEQATQVRELRRFTHDTKVVDFCLAKSIVLTTHNADGSNRQWYWCQDQRKGEIHGLPGICGCPRISNGVDVYIEREDGRMFLGHIEHFGRNGNRHRDYPVSRGSKAAKGVKGVKEALKTLKGEELKKAVLDSLLG